MPGRAGSRASRRWTASRAFRQSRSTWASRERSRAAAAGLRHRWRPGGEAKAMEDWITAEKIPLGAWIADFVDLLNQHAAFAFNAFSDGFGFLIDGLIEVM